MRMNFTSRFSSTMSKYVCSGCPDSASTSPFSCPSVDTTTFPEVSRTRTPSTVHDEPRAPLGESSLA